jgi:hypothetical protein
MFHPTSFRFLLTLTSLLTLAGCQGTVARPSLGEQLPPGSTYLLHLPGIAGDTPFDREWMKALQDGGASDRVELYDWTCNDPGLDALHAQTRNRVEAASVAQLIAARQAGNPTGKLILTAESGGTGVAIWALEMLPKGVMVDDALLIAPAISSRYDLSAALRHVRGKLYYFSSPGDWFVLGFGTSVFGTMDGKNVQAAGYVGFQRPSRPDAKAYAKLVEMRYDPAWAIYGDFGTHTGALSVVFARNVLAPLLFRDEHRGDLSSADW